MFKRWWRVSDNRAWTYLWLSVALAFGVFLAFPESIFGGLCLGYIILVFGLVTLLSIT
jgi:hypothetical protein